MSTLVRSWIRCFATAAVVVGPIFGLLAVAFALYTSHFLRHAARTTGTVTALTAQTDENKNIYYAPTFAFKLPSGQIVKKQSTTGNNPSAFSVGEKVPILFNLSNPQDAKINSTAQLWLLPIVSGIICVVFTSTGILLLRRPEIATAPPPFWTK